MAPRKRKAVDGEEEAVKAVTRSATTRVTRSSARIAESNPAVSSKKETEKVKAKAEGKKKKTAAALKAEKEAEALEAEKEAEALEAEKEAESLEAETEAVEAVKEADALKAEKDSESLEAETVAEAVEAEKEGDALKAEKEGDAQGETENVKEMEEVVQETEEAVEGDKRTIVIEHCKQCNSFKTRAIQVKTALEEAIPDISVEINPDKPRRGCLEIREKGGETFISLLDMKRPFQPMKELDMEKVITEIVDKIKG